MAKKFFVWKDPACNGEDVEWVELDGRAFCRLMKRAENRERKFIRMGNDICPEADVIYIEATKEQYADWHLEHRHHKYLCEFEKGRIQVSLDTWFDDEDSSLYDLIADADAEFEPAVLRKMFEEQLPNALDALTPARREAIYMKYFECPAMGDSEIAAKLGISRQAFTDRKNYGLADLKNFFEN